MDILRVLSSPDLEVRRKTLNLTMELVNSRNIEEMVLFLKKEVSKTLGKRNFTTSSLRLHYIIYIQTLNKKTLENIGNFWSELCTLVASNFRTSQAL